MSRESVFWGLILIAVGGLFLADNLGLFNFEFRLLWPFLLMVLGVYIIFSRTWDRSAKHSEQVTVPLDGATEANVSLEFGAGRVLVSGSAAGDQLLTGSFDAMRLSTNKQGSKFNARLSTSVEDSVAGFFPWNWNSRSREWDFKLNPNIPVSLKVECGASDTRLDLTALKVTNLDIETGASSTSVTMPSNAGHTRAEISGGAASFDITVPKGVAASIRVESGLGSISVDQSRFPRSGNRYESVDYATAANKLDLKIEVGVSSVSIK